MKKYKVYADLRYMGDYPTHGRLKGEIECESEEKLKEMIENGSIQDYIEAVVDDYGDIVKYEYELVEEQPDNKSTTAAIESVPMEVLRQVQWERDIAIDQLHSYGIEFGEKANVQKVRHGYWVDDAVCSECGFVDRCHSNYCPYCGAKMNKEDKK